jgi:hypothetical protein
MMSTKSSFAALLILVLICFAPVTLLWGLAVVMVAISIHWESFPNQMTSLIPFIITISLLFMGGIGLVGLIKMMKHIYRYGYKPADALTIRCLYAGILSLVILNLIILNFGFSVSIIVFVSPIVAAVVLIKLTTKIKSQKNSLCNDQII